MESGACTELSPHQLRQWQTTEKDFILIHTLGGEHFRQVHLPDAANACVFEVTFLDQIQKIASDRHAEIVLYGSSSRSKDATVAAEKLRGAGFERVSVLVGGIEAWREAGFPLEGERPDVSAEPQQSILPEDRTYRVDPKESLIHWTGRNANASHFGTVNIAEGHLDAKSSIVTGSVDIDMSSIKNINLEGSDLQPVLVDHLKSDDFFLTRLFPTASFEIAHAKPVENPSMSTPNYEVNGMLKLRGVRASHDFVATVARTPENSLKVEAHFDIDRTRWGIIYGSTRFFEHLGMHVVFDLISIEVRIVAV